MKIVGFLIFFTLCDTFFATNEPFYYFAPRHEGFGARYLQLREVYYEVVTKKSRPLVIMGNVNDLHHKDLFDKEMSLCDILGLPPTVTCIYNKSIDIIKTKKCQIPMSEAEYRSKPWSYRPFEYLTTPTIVNLANIFTPESGNKLEELQKKMRQNFRIEDQNQFEQWIHSNESFKYIGIDVVKNLDYTTSTCGLVYTYHQRSATEEERKYADAPLVYFSSSADTLFKDVMQRLQASTNVNWYEDVVVAHYRRGDKVDECNSPQFASRWNCKDIVTYINHLKEKIGEGKYLYIATNEEDPVNLKTIRENTITGAFYDMNKKQLRLNSYEVMMIELQLMVHVRRTFFIENASSLQYFVRDARFARKYPPIEYLT